MVSQRVGHDLVPKQKQVSFHQVKFINNIYILSNLSMYCPTFSKEEIKVFYTTSTPGHLQVKTCKMSFVLMCKMEFGSRPRYL